MKSSLTSAKFTPLPERRPGHRLITQNILSSAAEIESADTSDWTTIQDLSAFIDLFCLYEKSVVLARGGVSPYDMTSNFFGLLKDTSFIEIEHPTRTEDVAATASKHLITFLGQQDQDPEDYIQLLDFALQPDQASYCLTYKPDGVEEVQMGDEWFRSTPSHSDLLNLLRSEKNMARSATFLVRTFLYLAYADVHKITFTPDAVRTPVLEKVLDTEEEVQKGLVAHLESREESKSKGEEYREQLLSGIQSSWEQYPRTGTRNLERTVSPFAAVIFERSRSKKDIIREMENLRRELAPFRKRLGDLEYKALWKSRDEAIEADLQWNRLIEEIERSYGPDPQLITIRRAINYGERIGELIDKPLSWKALTAALVGLPAEVLYRLLSRRPAIELHRLRHELPSHERLVKAINRLFK